MCMHLQLAAKPLRCRAVNMAGVCILLAVRFLIAHGAAGGGLARDRHRRRSRHQWIGCWRSNRHVTAFWLHIPTHNNHGSNRCISLPPRRSRNLRPHDCGPGLRGSTSGCFRRSRRESPLPRVVLQVAPVISNVNVSLPPHELATEEVRAEEKQRVLGVFPNFFVTYQPNAEPNSSTFSIILISQIRTGGRAARERVAWQTSKCSQRPL